MNCLNCRNAPKYQHRTGKKYCFKHYVRLRKYLKKEREENDSF